MCVFASLSSVSNITPVEDVCITYQRNRFRSSSVGSTHNFRMERSIDLYCILSLTERTLLSTPSNDSKIRLIVSLGGSYSFIFNENKLAWLNVLVCLTPFRSLHQCILTIIRPCFPKWLFLCLNCAKKLLGCGRLCFSFFLRLSGSPVKKCASVKIIQSFGSSDNAHMGRELRQASMLAISVDTLSYEYFCVPITRLRRCSIDLTVHIPPSCGPPGITKCHAVPSQFT